jgi:hypothetical protein
VKNNEEEEHIIGKKCIQSPHTLNTECFIGSGDDMHKKMKCLPLWSLKF